LTGDFPLHVVQCGAVLAGPAHAHFDKSGILPLHRRTQYAARGAGDLVGVERWSCRRDAAHQFVDPRERILAQVQALDPGREDP